MELDAVSKSEIEKMLAELKIQIGNSYVLKGENNQAISENSVALGKNNVAGLKGWYYKAVQIGTDPNIVYLYLTTEQQRPILVTTQAKVENQEKNINVNISKGDICSIINGNKLIDCFEFRLNEMSKYGRISFTYKGDGTNPLTTIQNVEELKLEDYSVFCISKPSCGIVELSKCNIALGNNTKSLAESSVAIGLRSIAAGITSYTEGQDTIAIGECAHAEGAFTKSNGDASHAEGLASHAEGYNTLATGGASHSEGSATKATGLHSHAEGDTTESSGEQSHAEGKQTIAEGKHSHSEGYWTIAHGKSSHVEGQGLNNTTYSIASGDYSHSEGFYTRAFGTGSHTEGTYTIAYNKGEHAEGIYNKSTENVTLHSVGIGTSVNDRKNAHEITNDGKHYILGVGNYDGTKLDGITDVATVINNKADKSDLENINVEQLVKISYSDLKSLRDKSQLVPGQQYRITDYITTTSQTNTQSAGHQFDVIVLALTNETLSEIAWACHHEGDTYFQNSHLEAWQIWYCLDNDTSRFTWAVSTSSGGKGVIYRMIDEHNNDCPYDFKNIKFKVSAVLPSQPIIDIDSSSYVYTFSYLNNASYYEHSITKYVRCNTIKVYYSGGSMSIPLNAFVSNSLSKYTAYNILLEACTRNFFGTGAQENILYQKCQRNIFGDSCQRNTFEQGCTDNWFKHNFSNNYLEKECKTIRFSNNDSWETAINYIRNNRFKAGSTAIRLTNEETASSGSQIQNYIFNIKDYSQGCVVARSNKSEICVGYTATGTIIKFCLADMANMLSQIPIEEA